MSPQSSNSILSSRLQLPHENNKAILAVYLSNIKN